MVTQLPRKTSEDIDVDHFKFKTMKDYLCSRYDLEMMNGWWFEWTTLSGDGDKRVYQIDNDERLQKMLSVCNSRSRKVVDPRSVNYTLSYKRGPVPVDASTIW